jgi:hypothetical protein
MESGIATVAPALIAAWGLVAASCFVLAVLGYAAVRNRTRRVDLEKSVQAFRSPDVEAFRNLVDPSE